MSENRFKDVINAARTREEEPQQQTPQPPLDVRSEQRPAKRGRPAGGKRTNPDYEQVAAYIPKELNKRVKMRLLEMDKPREFSDLVEFLLKQWLQGPNGR